MLDAGVRDHLGEKLGEAYAARLDPTPRPLLRLASQLANAIAEHDKSFRQEFEADLVKALAKLRSFAISLTRDATKADDLVQDTIARALMNIGRFERGSNIDGWLLTILRNIWLTELRTRHRETEDPEGAIAERLSVPPEQEWAAGHRDLIDALDRLTPEHREAILLVGAQSVSYEEAAAICGVAVGTIKSRVNRARIHLARMLTDRDGQGLEGIASEAVGQSARQRHDHASSSQ